MLGKAFSAIRLVRPLPRAAQSAPTQNPLFLTPKHLSVVMAVHPNCPLSASSLIEMAKLYTRMSEEITVTILAFSSEADPEAWTASAELATLSNMEVRILNDTNGENARRLGITKSGEVKIFSPNGKLLYDGGIAPAPDRRWNNSGEEMIVEVINGSAFKQLNSPLYGRPLFDSPTPEPGSVLQLAHN